MIAAPEETAESLLIPLWRGIATAYKVKYARTIWDQFANAIKNAASTSDVGRFLDLFCQRMQCSLQSEDLRGIADFMQQVDGRKLLKSLREETTYLVLMVRVANEARKEEWKQQQTTQEEQINADIQI